MSNASIIEMITGILPEMTAAASAPLANVDKITLYGDGNQTKIVEDITTTISKIMSGIKDSTGIDVNNLLAGYIGGKVSSISAEQTD